MSQTITVPEYKALKKCPCCGEDPIIQQITGDLFPWRVLCEWGLCGMSTPKTKLFETAFQIWNRRRKAPKKATSKRKGGRYQHMHTKPTA